MARFSSEAASAVYCATLASAWAMRLSIVPRSASASFRVVRAFEASARRGWNIISPSCDTDLVVTPAAITMPTIARDLISQSRWTRIRMPSGTRHSSIAA